MLVHTCHRRWACSLLLLPAGPAPIPAQSIPAWSVQEELRIGSRLGDGALTRVSGLAVGPHGALYVGQDQERRVLRFSSSGERLAVIGRGGKGPGEFQAIDHVGLLAGGLYVVDQTQQRTTLFAGDGGVAATWRAPEIRSRDGLPRPAHPLTGGKLVSVPGFRPRHADPPRLPVLVLDTAAAARGEPARETIGWIDRTVPAMTRVRVGAAGTGMFPSVVSGETILLVEPDSGTVVLIDRPLPPTGARPFFTVTRISTAGDTLLRTRYRTRVNPMPEAYADSAARALKQRFTRMALRAGGERRDVEKAAEEYFTNPPRSQPAVSRAFAGADGTLWVQRSALGEAEAEWLVLSWSGEPIGRLGLSADITLMAADERRVWGVWRDELDVPYVIGYRIER